MSAGSAPQPVTIRARYPAVAANADLLTVIGEAPVAGTVTRVSLISFTGITGQDTESRTVNLYNRLKAGAGSAVVASKAFTAGISAAAKIDTPITLSATAANLVVAAGDVLEFQSLHIGTTGLADPGALVEIEIAPRLV